MTNVNNSKFVLLEGAGSVKALIKPSMPANLPQLGAFLGVLNGLPYGVSVKLIAQALGGENITNEMLKGFLRNLKFRAAEKEAGVQADIQVVALEKSDGNVNFGIRVHNNYQTAYVESIGSYHPYRSLFQDQVRFRIWPKDSAQVEIDHSGSIPKTDMKGVEYSNSTTWNTKVGFTGEVDKEGPKAGISGEVGYAFSISAGTKTTDFDMAKISEGQSDTLSWISQMRNMYKAGSTQPIATGYNPDEPYSLVVNSAFTKWLNDPPPAAKSDLELEYLAAYRSLNPDIKNELVEFEFSTTQRLMHAEVVGRWGIPGAEVGGVAGVVPYYLFTKGEIKIDLPNRQVEVRRLNCEGYDYLQQADKQQNVRI